MEASHPEQGTLQAWIEGQLDSLEHERIEAHLAECARCREAVAEARGLIAGASRIVAALDGAPAGVVPSRGRFGARRPRFVPARWAAAAAVLLFAATSVVVSREFRSGSIDLPATAIDAATRSDEGVASTPASAPAAVAEERPRVPANVPQARRSATTSAREPVPTVSVDQARTRALPDGGVSEVEPIRELSGRAGAAVANRVTVERDLAGKDVAGQAGGQIVTTAPAVSAPMPPSPPPVTRAPSEPRPSLERSQRTSVQPLSETVITGAAADAVGSRSARVVRVVRYEARPGVIVTLTEYEEPLRPSGPAIRIRGGQARAQTAAAPPEPQELSAAAPSPRESAYTWRHPERGRFYVLRGPLPLPELESLARRLGELKVVR